MKLSLFSFAGFTLFGILIIMLIYLLLWIADWFECLLADIIAVGMVSGIIIYLMLAAVSLCYV